MTWPGMGESSTITSHDRVHLPCLCRTSWAHLFCGARNACGDVSYRMRLAPSAARARQNLVMLVGTVAMGASLHPTLSIPRFPDKENANQSPLKAAFYGTGLRAIQLSARSRALQILVRGSSASQPCAFPCNGCPFCHPQLKAPHAALGLANRTTPSPLVRSAVPNHCLRSTRDARRQTWQYIV
jgi:hypothetical protein